RRSHTRLSFAPMSRFIMVFRRSTELLAAIAVIFVTGFALMKTVHSAPPSSHGLLVVANQKEHTALLVDPDTRKEVAKIPVGINAQEVTVDKEALSPYVPIYGDSGVGKPGSNGSPIDVIDIKARKPAYTIDLGKPLRPHDPHFGPDGLLYVTAELSQ